MREADPGFDLIETMRFDPHDGIVNLDRHLDRLKGSAGALEFRFDRHAARNELQAATFGHREKALLRLLVSWRGAMAIQLCPFDNHFARPVAVTIERLPVASDDWRLKHKTTDRGFYDEPFEVEISTTTAGAEIRYTLDGKPPTATTGTVYTGPVPIQRTTTLRARAFRAGLEPTNIDTHTYLFPAALARQTQQGALQAGFPATWGGTPADYEMDPDLVGPNDRFGGQYAQTIQDDLKSLPWISIVLPAEDLFGARGSDRVRAGRGPDRLSESGLRDRNPPPHRRRR